MLSQRRQARKGYSIGRLLADPSENSVIPWIRQQCIPAPRFSLRALRLRERIIIFNHPQIYRKSHNGEFRRVGANSFAVPPRVEAVSTACCLLQSPFVASGFGGMAVETAPTGTACCAFTTPSERAYRKRFNNGGCSEEFVDKLATREPTRLMMPGEVLLWQAYPQIYRKSHNGKFRGVGGEFIRPTTASRSCLHCLLLVPKLVRRFRLWWYGS